MLLHADGHDLVYAGICRRSAIGTRRLKRILRDRVTMVPNLEDERVAQRLGDLKPDLLVSWFWTKRIPKSILKIAPLGSVGIHPSLLPRHRGPDPTFWAIDSGDEKTGVTAHRLDEAYDTGAVLAQRELRIDPAWSAWTLAKKLDRPSLALLRQMTGDFASGKLPEPHVQDESQATDAPAPTDDDLEISFRWPAEKIVRRVRAASPWPGAFFNLGNDALTLTEARVTREFPRALEPGEAAVVTISGAKRAIVRAADHAIELISGRVTGNEADGEEVTLGADAIAERLERNV